MDRTFDPSRSPTGSPEEVDPWNEFLSESDELLSPDGAEGRPRSNHAAATAEPDFPTEYPPDLSSEGDPDLPAPPAPPAATEEGAPDVDTPGIDLSPPVPPVLIAAAAPAAHLDSRGGVSRPVETIAVRDVVVRQTPVQWAEAVAVVEELCATLISEGIELVPDSRDVAITGEGRVQVRAGAGGTSDPVALGQLLSALLTTASTPLPLRLFVTSSSASGRYRSIVLYADALSYYGTPGRTELIKALCQRAVRRHAVAPAAADSGVKAAPPPPAGAAANRSRSRVPGWVIAASIGIFAGGTIGALIVSQLRPEAAPPAAATPADAAGGAPQDEQELGPVTIERAPHRAPQASQPPSTSRVRPAAPAPRPAARRDTAASAGPPASAPAIPPVPSGTDGTLVTRDPGSPLPAVAPPRVTVPSGGTAAPDTQIYSAGDSDVEPPVMISSAPVAPPAPSPTDSFANNTVELIVDERGAVQRVSLLERPVRLPDVQMLQNYKMLKFSPARKDGRPVSYRYLLRVVSAPR